MPQGFKVAVSLFLSLIIVGCFTGCAARTYLNVDYQLHDDSRVLKGQVVHLQIKDQRPAGSILAAGAAYQLPDFRDVYSLALIMPDQQRILAGEHHLQDLFKTVIEKRLTALGGGTTESSGPETPVLTILLKQVTLDMQKHEWKADLNYDAVLSLAGHPTARENIHGSAERARILGSKGADKIFSELFSDSVNRLDLPKLFKSAELIP